MSRVQKLDTAGYQSMIAKLQKSKLDIADKIIAYAELNRAKMKSEWKTYQELAVPFIEKFCNDDYRRLNEVAYNFYERANDTNLIDKAIGWSERAVSLQDNIRHNHTLASLYYKAGRKKAAMDACNHTIELAKKNKVDYKQSTLLMEKIDELKEQPSTK
jgi:tetratricopeptide (TPR) repeat protein